MSQGQESDQSRPLRAIVRELLDRSRPYSSLQIRDLVPLAGDASTRQYVRCVTDSKTIPSFIVMKLSTALGPVGGGPRKLTQDDTFVELLHFFREHGVRVPELYLDAREDGYLLVEDIGDVALWNIVLKDSSEAIDRVLDGLPSDPVMYLYKKAVDVIVRLQKIPVEKEIVLFERTVSFEQYRKEISEVVEYLLAPKGLRKPEQEAFGEVFDAVCESIASHPRVPAHFDCMSHNVYVGPEKEIVLIDFQDASLNSPVRDILALLNDRDIDSALGKSRHAELLSYFIETAKVKDFARLYNEYLFHWDCRVSGRFGLLAYQKGRKKYEQWIDGTLRRLARTILRTHRDFPGMDDLLEIGMRYLPAMREGVEDPWPLPTPK
ncbi:MAG: phosphotransferase [Bdellovibrionales bacterium]|nr:phosphotransferase [Bdellovibrionales bacterium]